ncbi:MAG: molybdopterin molybdotransferase MoeA [Deltaproteobacteria bacterium]|nr:molybdopterin molybdotransferase MoeA [Deltaproteobacteria bacterium]
MISAHEAQNIILEKTSRLGNEEVPLSLSLHRYLAEPITAPIDLPPFDNAAMDGFAIQSGDTKTASAQNPVTLKVVGTIAAGDAPSQAVLKSGEYFRIMTGAPVPDGADAVVPFEEAVHTPLEVRIIKPVPSGSNIRLAGEDVKKDQRILDVGEKITSRTIALLAALGVYRIPVFRHPNIKILVTGSELTAVGHPLHDGKIYNSNGPALTAALQEIDIIPQIVVSSADVVSDLKTFFTASEEADALITIGAVSTGDFDFIPQVLKGIGAEIAFHKVSIKPGKPLLFATWKGKPIFGLPGNPVSALMVFERFVRPALLKMMGANNFLRRRGIAVATETLSGSLGKENYLRGIVESSGNGSHARSAGKQGSAHLLPLARANAILIVPPEKEEIRAGETVEFETFLEEL